MMLSLFDQFASPSLLGIPLLVVALIFPAFLLAQPSSRMVNNRLFIMQSMLSVDFAKQLFSKIKHHGIEWVPLLLSMMLFLLFLNLLGLLPYTFTPTTQLSMNLSFAVPMWLSTVLLDMRHQPKKALAHLLPEGTPTLLIPALIIIETISLFIRPLALGVRLTANLTAGHLLIQLFATAVFALFSSLPLVSVIVTSVLFLLTVLEVAVAMIQAYVFVLLLSLYLQENT
uniref:ATP synthase subunit a n=1 Tax=Scutiger ningshanensis TaxID=1240007 RepID=A0A1B1UUJ5_SCUNI|nr:ATP synthase F0 subunit 6 [Scutiger ningshanensis]